MFVIADISIIPMGTEASVSRYVSAAHKILKEAGLNARLCPYGTVVEGEYDQVGAALKGAIEKVHQLGAPRVSVVIKMGSRIDKKESAQGKIDSVMTRLAPDDRERLS